MIVHVSLAAALALPGFVWPKSLTAKTFARLSCGPGSVYPAEPALVTLGLA